MLTFIYSTVNAGKSANLLMRSHSCSQRDISYCTFVPEIASGRDGVNQISSRIGFKQEAISLKETDSPLEIMIDRMVKLYEKVEVIFIDEAQFLTKKQVKPTKFKLIKELKLKEHYIQQFKKNI